MSKASKDKNLKSQCLLVLGMHRSGTSAMTRCLNLLGMDVGSNLLAPNEVNARGFWEHADAVRINDRLLSSFGMQWYSLEPLPKDWMRSKAADRAKLNIIGLIERDFQGLPLWGLKDPRMCRLAPLWIETLQEQGIDVSAVFTSRSPVEIARSLERAQGIQQPVSVLMWLQHLAEAEIATRGLPRSMSSYTDLLSDPMATLERIGSDLALDWPMRLHSREAPIRAFLDQGLRSHRDDAEITHLPALVQRMLAACENVGDWKELSVLSGEAVEWLKLISSLTQTVTPVEQGHVHELRDRDGRLVTAELFRASGAQPFGTDNVESRSIKQGRNRLEWILTPKTGERYRLDPVSEAGYFIIHALQLLDVDDRVVWDWEQQPDQAVASGIESLPRPTRPGETLHRFNQDPQIVFDWSGDVVESGISLVLDIERLDPNVLAEEFSLISATFEHDRKDWEHDRKEWEHERQILMDRVQEARQLQQRIDTLQQRMTRIDLVLRTMLSSGLINRVRRRFLPIPLQLSPLQELVGPEPGTRTWKVSGAEAQFKCSSERFPLAPGWYLVDLEMQQEEGEPARPALFPDYGPDVLPELDGLRLHFYQAGKGRHKGFVYFPHPVHALRFDPARASCVLSLAGLSLRRVSRYQARVRLLIATIWNLRSRSGVLGSFRLIMKRLREGNLRESLRHSYEQLVEGEGDKDAYEAWVSKFDHSGEEDLEQARKQCEGWEYKPVISIVVPTYETDEQYLRLCIESVQRQVYPHWQLCMADDASPSDRVMAVLEEYQRADERIRVVSRKENGHISATSNSALELADGEFVALLDHDDELHPLALYEVVKALQEHRSWKLIYTDEDKIDPQGRRFDPYMKPDWNYDLLLAHNCISHLGVYQRQLVQEVGGFREGYEGSQDWDLALRCIECLKDDEIGHVPHVLYHWRAIPGSTALGVGEKAYARDAGLRAISEHLQRIGSNATVGEVEGRPGHFRVRYPVASDTPRISLIIPTRDGLHLLKQCVQSIRKLTTYKNYEIVIVDNQSREQETREYLKEIATLPDVRVLTYDHPFNYSALNNWAVARTEGEFIGLVNNDIEVITPDWLEEMIGHAQRPEVGAVGAMLYYPDDTIQHAGVVLGVHGVAAHSYSGRPRGYPGQMGRARLVQSLSAVTAACLVVRRDAYNRAGGLDENLRVAFNDVDFCLRLREAGYRNIWTPFAELYHHESATRGYDSSPEKRARFVSEVEYMKRRWQEKLEVDPAYSVNLTVSSTPYSLAFPPRHE